MPKKESAEDLARMRQEFVANVSHELKTPITLIKGFVETLMDGAKDDPIELERFLRIIQTHADRLDAIIEDLLSLSRIEQDQDNARITFETVRLKSVFDRVIQSCELAIKQKNIVVISACPDEIVCQANPALLEQALINLLDNAIKYGPAKSTVALSCRKSKGEIQISVADEGRGIEEKHLPYIFQRFYRVDKGRSRKEGGTGLGLAIVKHIIQAHGGQIEVESELDKGSIFTISLPIRK